MDLAVWTRGRHFLPGSSQKYCLGPNTDSRLPNQTDATGQYQLWVPNTKPSVNVGMAITDLNTNKVYLSNNYPPITGTISSNETWGNYVTVIGNLIVAQGVTLTIASGTTVYFTPGASITVNGTLNAYGTSSQPITFTRTGSSGTWNGIKFQNNGTGTLSYCDISNANVGVELSSYANVSNCNIQNNLVGIYLPMSYASITNNKIRNNSGHGIYAENGSYPTIISNIITGNFSSGIYCDLYSDLVSFSGNAIRYNCRGVVFNNSSGTVSGGGSNSIAGNYQDDASATCYSFPSLQSNWWGYNPQFYADVTSYIENYSPLGYDPNPNMNKVTASEAGNIAHTTVLAKSNPIASKDNPLNDTEIINALQLLSGKEYDKAIKTFDKKFADETSFIKKQFILAKISACYSLSKNKGLVDYLNKNIRTKLSKPDELYGVTLELEYLNLLRDGKPDEALAILNSLKSDYSSSKEIYKRTLYNLGFVYSKYLNDKIKAGEAIKELEAKYPGDDMVMNGKLLFLGEDVGGLNKRNSYVASDVSTPVDYMLSDNYPNPFNPTTNISFSIPQRSNVKLVVFDALGREVATLADNYYETGKHSVQFDASSAAGGLASGMYFYTLTTSQGTISKKMMLVK